MLRCDVESEAGEAEETGTAEKASTAEESHADEEAPADEGAQRGDRRLRAPAIERVGSSACPWGSVILHPVSWV